MAVNKRTYGELRYDHAKNRWIISHLEAHVCIKLKSVFQHIKQTNTAPFYFANLPNFAYELHWFMQRYALKIDRSDNNRLLRMRKQHLQTMADMDAILLPTHVPEPIILNKGMQARDYQLKGSALHITAKRLLIGDDVGLGKTLTAILSFFTPGTLPAAVVMQTHMQAQWREQINKFTNLTVHTINKTSPYSLPKADVYLFKYSQLSGWTDIFAQGFFKSATFDECQELRRSESEKYAAACKLSNNVQYCVGLSATPIYNYGDEIFNVLNCINQGCLGMQYQFLQEWCVSWGRHQKVKDPQALGSFLRENHLMLRRTRDEVGRELPPVNVIIQPVAYSEAMVDEAEDLATTLAIKATTGSFVERGQATRELDALARRVTGISKANEVAEFVKILLDNNEPVLLAGWHRSVYDIWAESLKDYKPVFYTGEETDKQKEDAKQKFIAGETNLFIISLRSGVGLDGLQKRCRYVVMGELDWSPLVHHQIIGRADRDGQPDQVTAIYCVSDYGSDPVIVNVCGLKTQQSHGILNPLADAPTKYTDESRLQQLAQQYLKNKTKKLEMQETAYWQ